MARPAKPPMTLREAKRAYKKDGGQFRYTASQMARADRQDAREEQRKKATEKEKQRQESKRKRDEKQERERAAKQKMLEEGRITVEDTWGKVTASQPRLNRFFVQRPTLVPSKRKFRDEIIQEEDSVSGGAPPSQGHTEEVENDQKKEITEDTNKMVFGAHPADPSPINKSQSEHDIQHVLSPPLALRDVSNSELNARPRDRQPQSSEVIKGNILRPPWPNSGKNARHPQVSEASKGLLDNVSASIHSNSTPEPQSSVTGRLGREYHPKAGGFTQKGSATFADPKAELCEIRTGPSGVDTDEEDFTDGIDDETFLMLCGTQKPGHDLETTKWVHSGTPPQTVCTGATPVASISPPLKEHAQPTRNKPESPIEPMAPMPITVHESFSAVFNEIEDEDLIALAEELEADLAAPSKPTATTASPTQQPQSKPISKSIPVPVPVPKPRTGRILTDNESKRRTGSPSPWEEFGAPGPSTQALMLELVEQAEAEMESSLQ
ncbi:hypothetical protein A1O3_02984 [Capronia epimyces CBS 606.96]|uniref:Uncharacterized protein n=1 Tax=Capronia epimyces CBS 606.96 TaxID=1182542 RepID=W9YAQ6_9EURO|nr:uncharacterized protein A1O3_02984 [Capronia epimyces CBS 606.96]EXJ89917.1 hypothetical protein A1O3_02984 [Capronia epimyces CBS 606.96]